MNYSTNAALASPSDDKSGAGPLCRRADWRATASMSAQVDTRHTFAIQHLWNARRAARQCRELEAELIATGDHRISVALRGLAMMAAVTAPVSLPVQSAPGSVALKSAQRNLVGVTRYPRQQLNR